jgi:sugar phosphate isomerase/epimerase
MMTDRRTFLAGSAGLAALGVAGALPASAAQLGKVGIQLYTVRELFQKDPVATLGQIAKIGYREVEYGGGGYDSMDHAMLRKTMDRLGLTSPSIHVGYDLLLNKFDDSVKMAKTLGADTIVLPFMTPEHRTAEGWEAALPNFNKFARELAQNGLGFAYHNHDFEFTTKPDGVSLYDRFIKATDPKLVKVEIDLYWAIHAGEDAAALIKRMAGRIYAYHVKDQRPDGNMTSVGLGTIDFGKLFKLNSMAGVKHFYVENDESPAPYIPDITTSFQTLRKLRF